MNGGDRRVDVYTRCNEKRRFPSARKFARISKVRRNHRQATGNYYCWGKDIITRPSGKLAFEWNPRTRRSERQRRTGGLNHVWATEKGPSTKIVAPPFFEACGSAMKSRVSWLVIDGSRPNAAINSGRAEFARNAEIIASVALEFSLPLKINARFISTLITLHRALGKEVCDYLVRYRLRTPNCVFILK